MKVIVIYGCREGLDPHISGLTTLRQKIIIIIICQMFLIPWAYSSRPDVLDFLSPDILFIMLQKKKKEEVISDRYSWIPEPKVVGQMLLIQWSWMYLYISFVSLSFCYSAIYFQAVQVLFADPRGVLVIVLWKQRKPLIFLSHVGAKLYPQ